MRNKHIVFKILTAVLLFALLLPALSASAGKRTRVLKVGYFISDNFQEGGSDDAPKSGYAYEVLQKISDYTGWEYRYVYGSWEELYEMFLKGKIDLFAGLSRRDDRLDLMEFTDTPLDIDRHFIYARADDFSLDADDLSTFNGKKIGCIPNSIMHSELVEWIDSNGISAELGFYSTLDDLVDALEAGEVDGVIALDNGVNVNRDVRAVILVKEDESFICVRKNALELLNGVNEAYAFINRTTPNYFRQLSERYFSNIVVNVDLTEEEDLWIEQHPELRIGYVDKYMPFSASGDSDRPDGLMADALESLLDKIGVRNRMKLTYVAYPNYTDVAAAIQNREVDIVFPVINSIWHSEQAHVMETAPVVSTPLTLIYHGEYDPGAVTSIAVSAHSPMQQIFVDKYCEGVETITVETPEACLDAVLSGTAGCTVFTSSRAKLLLSDERYEDLRQVQMSNSAAFCFGVGKGEMNLLSLLDRGIAQLDKTAIDDLLFEYSEVKPDYSLKGFIHRNILPVLLLVLLILGLLFIMFLIYRRGNEKQKKQLKLMVREREERIRKEQEIAYWNSLMAAAAGNVYSTCIAVDLTADTYHVIIADFPEDSAIYTSRTASEMLEKGAMESPEGEDRARYLEKFSRENQLAAYARGERRIELKHRRVMPDGDQRWEKTTVIFLNSPDDHIRQIGFNECIDREIMQTNALRDALDAAQRAYRSKSEFLSSISHDIRTPMNTIIGFVDLALRHFDDPERVQDALRKIGASSNQLLGLVNDLLDMSRIESGKVRIEEKPVVLSDVIRDLVAVITASAEKKNQKLFVNAAELSDEPVMCDSNRFNRVILNIMTNAIKYSPEGSRIELNIYRCPAPSPDHDAYEFRIRDYGIGMSPEFIAHIFEPFERDQTAVESGAEGSGLGMAIVKMLLDLMGGTISVESVQGKGSVFTVNIPFRKYLGDLKSSVEEIPDVDFSGKKVLLVEDNALNREIAVEILIGANIVVDTAEDGRVAVEKMRAAAPGDYDLILMDIQMPVMDGCDATLEIRRLPDKAVASIPIIAMTANAFEEDKQIAFEVGMNAHLSKPIDVRQLFNTLSEYL